jgi:hypothetical protein
MQVERHVDAARLTGFQISINVVKNGFIGVEVIEVSSPKAIINGNTNKIKSKLG